MMEIEKSPQEMAKKLWNVMRVVLYMIRKGVSKSKFMFDFHMLLKQGKLASKAISNLMFQHHHNYYAALTCRSSNDAHMSFISPREYEFSCSNTPLYSSHNSKRKNHRRRRHHHHHHHHQYYQAQEFNVMQKVFDILNHYDTVEASPLPGFGHSPNVRQLRVTDSPFSLKDMEEMNHQVDKDAEEFIKKFYKDLKSQKSIAAALAESPSPYHIWAR